MKEKTREKKVDNPSQNGNRKTGRVEVAKTYKLYIGGQFPELNRAVTLQYQLGKIRLSMFAGLLGKTFEMLSLPLVQHARCGGPEAPIIGPRYCIEWQKW